MHELEFEIKRLRVLMLQSFDDGDEVTGDEYVDEIDVLAKILNSGMSKAEYAKWLDSSEHEHENHHLPAEIRNSVIDAIDNANLNKEMVDDWNPHLDFDLHEKLQTYGFVGSARLNKIFAV